MFALLAIVGHTRILLASRYSVLKNTASIGRSAIAFLTEARVTRLAIELVPYWKRRHYCVILLSSRRRRCGVRELNFT